MNAKIFLPLILLMLSAFTVAAWDETYAPVYDYSEGDWNDTHTAAMAADYDYTDFGSCDGYCVLTANFTTNATGDHYGTAIWGINFTDVVNGEDATSIADCWDGGSLFSVMIIINTSDLDNSWLGCEDRTSPLSWLALDDAYNASAGGGNISGMYLYVDDVVPTVTMDDSINGTTKDCDEDAIRESDIIFTADDDTDDLMRCCVYVDDVEDTSSCNATTEDNVETVLHTDALGEGDNTVYVRCEDETHYGDSNSMTLRGNVCAVCNTDWMADFIKFAVLTALLLFFAANYFAGSQHFKTYWWYIAAFIAICFIIWWLQNWNC